jgi:hypothetical protein
MPALKYFSYQELNSQIYFSVYKNPFRTCIFPICMSSSPVAFKHVLSYKDTYEEFLVVVCLIAYQFN